MHNWYRAVYILKGHSDIVVEFYRKGLTPRETQRVLDFFNDEVKYFKEYYSAEWGNVKRNAKKIGEEKKILLTLGIDFYFDNNDDVFECFDDYQRGVDFCKYNNLDFDERLSIVTFAENKERLLSNNDKEELLEGLEYTFNKEDVFLSEEEAEEIEECFRYSFEDYVLNSDIKLGEWAYIEDFIMINEKGGLTQRDVFDIINDPYRAKRFIIKNNIKKDNYKE